MEAASGTDGRVGEVTGMREETASRRADQGLQRESCAWRSVCFLKSAYLPDSFAVDRPQHEGQKQ